MKSATPKKRLISMQWLVVAVLGALVTACASIGRPEGGPRDETPPEFVYSTPGVGARNVNRQRLDLYFNENVQLQDAFNKVIVSPAQKQNARITANGRHVIVELQDTLLPNTTYTIDFADAIKDLNEGNVLDGFTTYFSTGDTIDSLRISGIVLEARTLEPAQGMLVGVYSNLSDTAIRTLPLERIARTNQLGQFTIHNLKPGDYRIYALNDLNRDFKWDRSEDIAFYDVTVSPRVEAITVTDTLRSVSNTDSLVQRRGEAYFPNDVLLTWFNEDYKAQYLKDYKRPDRRYFEINMAAPSDSLPRITIASGPHAGRNAADWTMLKANATLDSLTYWITDTAVMSVDSLLLAVDYQRTDTADMLVWKSDTLKFFFKEPKQQKKKKKVEDTDTVAPPVKHLELRARTPATQEVNRPAVIVADQPIDSIVASGVHLEIKVDTLWKELPDIVLRPDSLDPLLTRELRYKWQPGEKYRLTVDSAAVAGIYGETNQKMSHEFSVRPLEEYSNLVLNIKGTDRPMVAELLDKNDKVIALAPVVGGVARFPYQMPATVYVRAFIDDNNNGRWDTGNLTDSIQPEEVYYFPKKIVLKKNWDITQDWNIYETAYDLQKPNDIKKNKPKVKKGEQNTYDEEEEDEEENNIFSGNNAYSNSRRNNTNGRSPGRNNNMMRNPMGGMLR